MGLFGFGKKKEWDIAKSDANKAKIKALFNQVVEDNEGYKVVYAYTSEVKTSNYILARKTTYLYGSYILGYRENDMSLILIQTSPDLDGCGEPVMFQKGHIKKAKTGPDGAAYLIYHEGGLMAGYTQFYLMEEYDSEYFAYVYQPGTIMDFESFWNKFRGK